MSKKAQQIAAFAFGVVFISVLLVIAMFFPHPTDFQYMIFKTVLSLAMAGSAAMVPGFMEVNISTWLRASGAMAVLAITYFYNPVGLVTQQPEKVGAKLSIENHRIAYAEYKNDDHGSYMLTPELEVVFRNSGDTVAVIKDVTCKIEKEAIFEQCSRPLVQAFQKLENEKILAAEWEQKRQADKEKEEKDRQVEKLAKREWELRQINAENQKIQAMLQYAQESGKTALVGYLNKVKYMNAPRVDDPGLLALAKEAKQGGELDLIIEIASALAPKAIDDETYVSPEDYLFALTGGGESDTPTGAGGFITSAGEEVHLGIERGNSHVNYEVGPNSAAAIKLRLVRHTGGVAPALYKIKLSFNYDNSEKTVAMEPIFIKMSGTMDTSYISTALAGISEDEWDACSAEAQDVFRKIGYTTP